MALRLHACDQLHPTFHGTVEGQPAVSWSKGQGGRSLHRNSSHTAGQTAVVCLTQTHPLVCLQEPDCSPWATASSPHTSPAAAQSCVSGTFPSAVLDGPAPITCPSRERPPSPAQGRPAEDNPGLARAIQRHDHLSAQSPALPEASHNQPKDVRGLRMFVLTYSCNYPTLTWIQEMGTHGAPTSQQQGLPNTYGVHLTVL